MVVIWGTQKYGKVDLVPGLFYVASDFAHVQFIPLFPTASYLILDGTQSSKGSHGVRIPMSGKSVLVGYLRAALFVALLALVGFGIATVGKEAIIGALLIAAGLFCGLVFLISYKLTRPGPQRALMLAQQAGIPPEVVAQHFVKAKLLPDDKVTDEMSYNA